MRQRAWIGACVALVSLLAWAHVASAQSVTPRCEDYPDQPAAQRAFDGNPERFRDLDNDGDGVACEHLFGTRDDGGWALPWLLAGAVLLGLGAGTALWLMRRRRTTPEKSPATVIAPEDDTGVEIELAALKAADAKAPGQVAGREPDTSS